MDPHGGCVLPIRFRRRRSNSAQNQPVKDGLRPSQHRWKRPCQVGTSLKERDASTWVTSAPDARVSSLGMLAMVFDVWFRPQDVGDLFLRTRRDGLVNLELWDGRPVRAVNVFLREVLVVGRHGGFL
jgi:hypothetical protein